MTLEQLEILAAEQTRLEVERNLGRDPLEVALDKGVPHAALVSSQVKYLARAQTKLPSYYSARCILPSLAFEQSSGEAAAFHKRVGGELCVDLTCGLGVDAYRFSHAFRRVVTVERDPVLAAVARHNFALLGAANIEVVEGDAEWFVAERLPAIAAQGRIDMIYADPDRRDGAGRKMVALADCSPNIGALLPRLREAAQRVVVKLSPMFDIHEVVRIFGPHVRAEAVSAGGECKEVVAESDESIPSPLVRASVIGGHSVEYPWSGAAQDGTEYTRHTAGLTPADFALLVVPDVALAKTGTALRYFRERGAAMEDEWTFAFYREGDVPDHTALMGRVYRITAAEKYAPKALKKELKAAGVKRLNIMRRNFPWTPADIARQLGVAEGGGEYAAFTRMDGKLWMIRITPVL